MGLSTSTGEEASGYVISSGAGRVLKGRSRSGIGGTWSYEPYHLLNLKLHIPVPPQTLAGLPGEEEMVHLAHSSFAFDRYLVTILSLFDVGRRNGLFSLTGVSKPSLGRYPQYPNSRIRQSVKFGVCFIVRVAKVIDLNAVLHYYHEIRMTLHGT